MHAQARAQERLGLDIDAEGMERIARRIRHGSGRTVIRTRGNRSVVCIDHQGESLYVVFDRRGGNVVTVLSPQQVRQNGWTSG